VLEIHSAFADALHRLEPGDELIVLTWLHLADRDVLQTHPRGDERIPLTGVFRTPVLEAGQVEQPPIAGEFAET
jgi:tRNA (Thr-GGU) A37 N-methylase